MPPSAPPEPDFAPTASRPASLWPDSTRPAELAGATSAWSRFDPAEQESAQLQAQAAATFDVCHPALALRGVLLVQLGLAVVALAGAASAADWGARQSALAFAGVVGSLLWLVAVCALQGALRRCQPPLRAALVLALGAGAALAGWWPLWWAGFADPPSSPGGTLRMAGLMSAGAAFAALLWAWLGLRARIWQPAEASARLTELQSRIRPHFLFNTLNTALALVRVDPARAESVLEDLAELFRVALAETGVSVTMAEEIELARRYLAIEQVRFGPRLQVQWQVDARVHLARIPPLVLQPLVENAVRHGIEPALAGGRVIVSATVQRGQAVLVVSNTLGAEAGHPGHGMALHNVRERLRLLHDVAAQCDVWHAGGMFHARIVLPL